MNRRSFLGGLLTALAAPAIIRTPGLLMAVKAVPEEVEWVGNGLTTPGMIGFGFSSIMRRAFIPKLFVQIYQSSPEVQAIWNSIPPESRAMVAFNG